jgi:hypothetical protein
VQDFRVVETVAVSVVTPAVPLRVSAGLKVIAPVTTLQETVPLAGGGEVAPAGATMAIPAIGTAAATAKRTNLRRKIMFLSP